MNDSESAPEPAIDFTAFDRNDCGYVRLVEELLPANKAVLFDALAAAGIENVIVTFDGYSDSGQIENIEATAAAETIPLPSDRIEIARTTWGSPKIEFLTQTVQETVETLVYDFLQQAHSGWEINDGAYGEFTFDVAERTIKLDYNERYTSSENYSHEF